MHPNQRDMNISLTITAAVVLTTAVVFADPFSNDGRTSIVAGAEETVPSTTRYMGIKSGMIAVDQVAGFIKANMGEVRKALGKSAVPPKGEGVCLVLGLDEAKGMVDVLAAMPVAPDAPEHVDGLVNYTFEVSELPAGELEKHDPAEQKATSSGMMVRLQEQMKLGLGK